MQDEIEVHRALHKVRTRFWRNSFYWSFLFLLLWSLYFYYEQGFYNFGSFAESFEQTAYVMIAVSFGLGTFAFYFNVLDNQLGYRKYFGLVGFWYLVLYFFILITTKPESYGFKQILGSFNPEFTLLVIPLLIMALMALISQGHMPARLGAHLWRNLLRAGYSIYAFLIPRAIIFDGDSWVAWQQGLSSCSLPPPSLLTTALAVVVILFRLSVFPVRVLRKFFLRPKAGIQSD